MRKYRTQAVSPFTRQVHETWYFPVYERTTRNKAKLEKPEKGDYHPKWK
jgi:hypothetical protein